MIRILDDDTRELDTTSISDQDYLEDDLREWIIDDSSAILGEDVLLVGREVRVKDIGDGIDLLGIDPDGKIVIIELKQGKLRGSVDFQALKYAAYTSHWNFDQLEAQFENFKDTDWGADLFDEDTTFNEALEEFCNEEYTLNEDQRIVLVGESMGDRLEIVSQWLGEKEVDITVIEVGLLEDEGRVYLDANRSIPLQTSVGTDITPDTTDQPWKSNGRDWHLETVTNDETARLLNEVVGILSDIDSIDGPYWGQQQYVSFRQNRRNRVLAYTQKTLFHLELYDVDGGAVDEGHLATKLGVPEDDVSTDADDIRDGRPGVGIACRPGQGLKIDELGAEFERLLEADSS
jgi:hypothetical protein